MRKIIFGVLVGLVLAFVMPFVAQASQVYVPLKGEGTKKSPYLIERVEDLIWFRDTVNTGDHFEDIYFRQTENLDLDGLVWEPIGIFGTDYYFAGSYDGAGHYVENVNLLREDNCALFAVLAGTVMNLGLESGRIEGACVAGIAGHSQGDKAKVINCYNKATISGGYRAGGIVDNFEGEVYGCVNMGTLEAPAIGQVAGYHVRNAVCCYGIDSVMFPSDTFSGSEYGCEVMTSQTLKGTNVAERINRNVFLLKQDAAVNIGKMCYWKCTNGELSYATEKPYSDWQHARELEGMEMFSNLCICLAVLLIICVFVSPFLNILFHKKCNQ